MRSRNPATSRRMLHKNPSIGMATATMAIIWLSVRFLSSAFSLGMSSTLRTVWEACGEKTNFQRQEPRTLSEAPPAGRGACSSMRRASRQCARRSLRGRRDLNEAAIFPARQGSDRSKYRQGPDRRAPGPAGFPRQAWPPIPPVEASPRLARRGSRRIPGPPRARETADRRDPETWELPMRYLSLALAWTRYGSHRSISTSNVSASPPHSSREENSTLYR